jgi:hypothetical protein
MSCRLWISVLPIAAIGSTATVAPAGVLLVPADYPTIQAGVDASALGDTVQVSPGMYTDYETRMIGGGPESACVFLKDGVVVLSEQGPQVTTIDMQSPTVLFGGVVFGIGLYSNQTLMEGFTLTGAPAHRSAAFFPDAGGYKMTFRNCVFRDLDGGVGTASAIAAARSDLDLVACEFRNCVGGLAAVYQLEANLLVSDCRFEDCGRGIEAFSNAAPYPSPFRLEVVDSEFRRCQPLTGSGGAILASDYNAGIQITNCWFEDCSAEGGGGAVSLTGTGPNAISNCVFRNNRVTLPGGAPGALMVGFGTIQVTGCTFFESAATHTQLAGALLLILGTSTVTHNVFAGTTKGVAMDLSGTVVTGGGCNVFWDNPDGDVVGYTLASSDRVVDPQFCDPDSGDFTVTTLSPCLPAHSQGCGQIGARGWGCEPISIDPKSWGEIKAGYRQEPDEGAKP